MKSLFFAVIDKAIGNDVRMVCVCVVCVCVFVSLQFDKLLLHKFIKRTHSSGFSVNSLSLQTNSRPSLCTYIHARRVNLTFFDSSFRALNYSECS